MRATILFCAVSLLGFPPSAFAASNIAFAVAAEDGLRLEYTVLAKDGTQLMDSVIGDRRDQNGALSYVITIDGDVISHHPVDKWCVKDVTGKWSLLQKAGAAATTLCDSAPTETNGTFQFVPDPLPSGLTATDASQKGSGQPVSAATANSSAIATTCVQQALNTLDFKVGKPDGALGKSTIKALQAFLAANKKAPRDVPMIDASMPEWCLYLARENNLDPDTANLASTIAKSSIVDIVVETDPKADFRVAVGQLGATPHLIDVTPVPITYEKRAARLVAFPYGDSIGATNFCVFLAKGWRVKASATTDKKARGFLCWSVDFPFVIEPHGQYWVGFAVEQGEPQP